MGRLFWKFFFAILLAQVAATLGVGATFWVRSQTVDQRQPDAVDTGNRATATLDAAEMIYKYGGAAGLLEFLRSGAGAGLYVVDAAGKALADKPVPVHLRAEAEQLRAHDSQGRFVRSLSGQDGQILTAFVSRAAWHGGGAPGGPLAGHGGAAGFASPPLFGGPGGGGPGKGGPGGEPRGPRIPYIGIVVGTLASFLFAGMLAWYISRPIRALRAAFAAAASGDLTPRFGGKGRKKSGKGDELVELGPEFDRMSGKLWALMDNQQRLLHDVSHELRSPLARLQAAIGLAHQSPDKMASSLARIERESERMDKLVGELLTLSRLDSAINLPPLEPVAIGELVHQIAIEADFEAELCGRRVTLINSGEHSKDGAQIQGSPDLLWRGIENIVRNGVKYSPPGGIVEIEVETVGGKDGTIPGPGRVFIRVRDRGPGVAEHDLATIFQPFFRAQASANNIDGHGLGLAIAQRVIAAHGGKLSARNRLGGGLCVTIELPCELPRAQMGTQTSTPATPA